MTYEPPAPRRMRDQAATIERLRSERDEMKRERDHWKKKAEWRLHMLRRWVKSCNLPGHAEGIMKDTTEELGGEADAD